MNLPSFKLLEGAKLLALVECFCPMVLELFITSSKEQKVQTEFKFSMAWFIILFVIDFDCLYFSV